MIRLNIASLIHAKPIKLLCDSTASAIVEINKDAEYMMTSSVGVFLKLGDDQTVATDEDLFVPANTQIILPRTGCTHISVLGMASGFIQLVKI